MATTNDQQEAGDHIFNLDEEDDDNSVLLNPTVLVSEENDFQFVPPTNSVKILLPSQKSEPYLIKPPIFHVQIPMRVLSISKSGKLGICSESNCHFIRKFHQKYETLTYREISELTLRESEVSVGMVVAVLYKTFWCRGMLERLDYQENGKCFAEVYMMDYAAYTSVSLKNIRKVFYDHRNIRCHSYEFTLFAVTDVRNNDKDHDSFTSLKEYLLGRVFLTEFVFSKPMNPSRCEYGGFMKTENADSKNGHYKDVGELILRNGWSSYISPRDVLLQLQEFKNWVVNRPREFELPPELALNTKVNITISHVNSFNDFYVRKSSDSELFSHIETRLNSSLSKFQTGFHFWSNDEVIEAQSTLGVAFAHRRWHRVQLRKLFHETKMAEVFLIDRGDIFVLHFNRIYQIPKDLLKYPSLVFHCSLHLHFTPEGKSHRKILQEKFRRLHKKCPTGQELTLTCFRIVDATHTVSLDTGRGQDYGSALVKLGWGAYDNDNEQLVEPENYPIFKSGRDVLFL